MPKYFRIESADIHVHTESEGSILPVTRSTSIFSLIASQMRYWKSLTYLLFHRKLNAIQNSVTLFKKSCLSLVIDKEPEQIYNGI